jgi:formylglycine-generating enzyme required for sulfatase activity
MTRKIDYSQFTNVVLSPNSYYNQVNQYMIEVPGGSYLKGDLFNENVNPELKTVPSMFVAATATSFDEFDKFCNAEGWDLVSDENWGRENSPVINVNLYMALLYCNWLSELEGLTPRWKVNYKLIDESLGKKWNNVEWQDIEHLPDGTGYTLPTEDEWEYVARAKANEYGDVVFGAKTRFGNSTDIADPREINCNMLNVSNISYAINTGNPDIDYRRQTVEVDQLKPSDGGFFNMSGNVWECALESGLFPEHFLNLPDAVDYDIAFGD